MPRFATSIIQSDVSYSCRSGSPDDIASAMAVYNFYCSAARKEVVATGVSESSMLPHGPIRIYDPLKYWAV